MDGFQALLTVSGFVRILKLLRLNRPFWSFTIVNESAEYLVYMLLCAGVKWWLLLVEWRGSTFYTLGICIPLCLEYAWLMSNEIRNSNAKSTLRRESSQTKNKTSNTKRSFMKTTGLFSMVHVYIQHEISYHTALMMS